MPLFTLNVETTSNNTAGTTGANTALQWLMPAGRNCQLLGVFIKQQLTAAGENSGNWVVDRISAVTAGSTLVPLQLDPTSRASDITDTTKTMSTTLGCTNTVVATTGVQIFSLADGWNDLAKYNIYAGAAQGFGIRRSTAPTGARVVEILALWSE